MELTSGSVVDRYTIDEPIGRGGMAIVYRARHNQLGTMHAIKVLTVGANSIKKRLLQEGRAQATLSHPNIVNVTDVIDVGGSPGLVMEIIDGPSMDDFLQDIKLTFDQVDELAQGVIAGVAEAHRHGLIHRDLKPANVMLKVTTRGFVPKVTDFGLAKALNETGTGGAKTRSGAVMGTPYYMAPEQIRDSKNVDQRADIFSLGAMLYEMVAGERPFEREDILETYTAIASGDFVPLDMKVPGCPDRFVKAVHGALAVKAADRIADCDTLLAIWSGKEVLRGDDGVAVAAAGPWSSDTLKKAQSLRPRSTNGGESRPSSPSGGEQTWQPDDPTSGRHKSISGETLSRKNTGGGTASAGNVSVMYQEDAFSKPKSPSMSRSRPPASFSPTSGSTSLSQAPPEKPSRMPMFLGVAVALGGLGLGIAGVGLGLYASMGKGPEPAAAAAPIEAPVVAPPAVVPAEVPAEAAVVAVPAEVPPAEPPPEAPAEVAKATVPKAPKQPKTETPKAAEAPKVAAGKGTLVVNSKPWSDLVTIDGTPGANTPYKTPMAAGKHKVSLHANDGRTYEGTVEVTPDQTTIFCWDFDQGAMCQR